jgi:hypothetical protein
LCAFPPVSVSVSGLLFYTLLFYYTIWPESVPYDGYKELTSQHVCGFFGRSWWAAYHVYVYRDDENALENYCASLIMFPGLLTSRTIYGCCIDDCFFSPKMLPSIHGGRLSARGHFYYYLKFPIQLFIWYIHEFCCIWIRSQKAGYENMFNLLHTLHICWNVPFRHYHLFWCTFDRYQKR